MLFHTCADQQSVDWLIAALHGLLIREGGREGGRLETNDAKHLPKPVKMALRTGVKVSSGSNELL
jgi:hypothetical protein